MEAVYRIFLSGTCNHFKTFSNLIFGFVFILTSAVNDFHIAVTQPFYIYIYYILFSSSVGILAADTWRYYINNFGCSHFKGTGLEDNYY